jgi:glutathione peroxidase
MPFERAISLQNNSQIMIKQLIYSFILSVALSLMACGSTTQANSQSISNNSNTSSENTMNEKNLFDFKVKTIEGKEVSLADYKGKKLLFVNVASKCGYTGQYADLQAVYKKYGDKLVILGFPANNFGGQEPGTNEEIAQFCSLNYGVTFPMFEKISVAGSDQHELYQWLAAKAGGKSPSWNFCKYLVSEDGTKVEFFGSSTNPVEIAEKL